MKATTCLGRRDTTSRATIEPMPNLAELPAVALSSERSGGASAISDDSVVYVVDEDGEVCRALGALLLTAGHLVHSFHNVADFLAHDCHDINSCLLVEAGTHGTQALEVLHRSAGFWPQPVVVLMTLRHGDIGMAVNAMKAGAVDVLTKPLLPQQVLEAVAGALAQDLQRRTSRESAMVTLQRAATLTSRELQVMALVTSGMMNKQVASELSLSEISIKIHRGNLMKKMGLRTLPDLVRAADLLRRHP